MATATAQDKTSTSDAAFDLPSVEETTQRIRDLNERLIDDYLEKLIQISASVSTRASAPCR